MNQAAWLLLPPAVWAGYAWGSHALTLASGWRGPRLSGKVALTFDDGPDAAHTPRVLDVLAAHGIKASFFLIGERAAREPALARRIAEEGHDLGNHTWSHRSLWLSGPRETARQVGQGHAAIAEAAGAAPRFFRPPWGMRCRRKAGARPRGRSRSSAHAVGRAGEPSWTCTTPTACLARGSVSSRRCRA